jgi:superfamily II DNA or RNA helicase
MSLKAAGYKVVYVTSKSTPEERQNAMNDFHSGTAQIMVNCGILTTGYDHPPIECVIMNRATMSIPLWLQCCGRGSRLSPGKEEFILIDMGGNVDRLGRWEEPRDWKYHFFHPKKAGQTQPAPVKECPECESILPARTMKCDYCGYEFPESERETEAIEGELVALKKAPNNLIGKRIDELTTGELFQLYRSERYKKGFILRVLRSRGISELMAFASIAKFKPGWAYHQINEPKNYANIRIK